MRQQMPPQRRRNCERLPALLARERTLSAVDSLVVPQVIQQHKLLFTSAAFVLLFSSVLSHVVVQARPPRKALPARRAAERLLVRVKSAVDF